MRVFQEEIFGPVVAVTSFTDFDDAISTANDTLYGLGAGVWTRDVNTAYRAGRGIKAGRVWTNCYHAYPAHAAFGGYKQSGIGRENHKMMLEHYQQTKNLLVSYSRRNSASSSNTRSGACPEGVPQGRRMLEAHAPSRAGAARTRAFPGRSHTAEQGQAPAARPGRPRTDVAATSRFDHIGPSDSTFQPLS